LLVSACASGNFAVCHTAAALSLTNGIVTDIIEAIADVFDRRSQIGIDDDGT
jgi:hypothetical protein